MFLRPSNFFDDQKNKDLKREEVRSMVFIRFVLAGDLGRDPKRFRSRLVRDRRRTICFAIRGNVPRSWFYLLVLAYLVYLEIGVGVLKEVKSEKIKYDVSCLDISPIGEDPDCSQLAAVGVWMDTCVRIFSLPNLQLLTKEHLGEEIARSVLLCKLEGISYMLCALGDGHLLNFTLNQKSGHLTDMKKVSLGSQPISFRTFQIFAASNKPTVIYRSNKRLLYSSVINLKEVHHACPLYSTSFPNSLAFAENDELIIGTVEYPKLCVVSILVKEHAFRICHQDCSQSFAL